MSTLESMQQDVENVNRYVFADPPAPVHFWPHCGPLVLPDNGVTVIGLRLSTDPEASPEAERENARTLLREAVCEVMQIQAHREGKTWRRSQLKIVAEPGQPPQLTHPALLGRRQSQLSFTHQPGCSLAALSDTQRVGIDLMRIEPLPDWKNLAQDYLGPHAAAALVKLPAAEIPAAFAAQWTAFEARLKCLGQTLTEWSPALDEALATTRLYPLLLPAGWVGALATLA